MTLHPLKKPAIDHPGERQARAADPKKSVWVGASAGTGKTKVLVDRLLRLMLPRPGENAASASRPEKILCLTFTKTAAAEMSSRIHERLRRWAVMDDAALEKDLLELSGEKPAVAAMREARRLFARVLDAPGGLKIMTIHSFCQSVLKRFPVEAGLAPHFELMDDRAMQECLTRGLHDIVAASRLSPDAPGARAFATLALYLNVDDMARLMSGIMAKRHVLDAAIEGHGGLAGAIASLRGYLGVAADETEESVLVRSAELSPAEEKDLRQALKALIDGGGKEDAGKAQDMQLWLEAKDRRPALFFQYQNAFLTDGAIRKRLATKEAVKIFLDVVSVMQREAERIVKFRNQISAARLADINAALLTIAADLSGRYARLKRDTDRLDYDDLIIRTADLLARPGMVNWVLFKLDEGIDHILVDEAQDTSPLQWRVIQALADEFFDDKGLRSEKERTLFVVGDEKQSIFSFHGADPSKFGRMQGHFGGKALVLQKEWEVFLEHSFRSTRAVLDVVDGVYAQESVRRGVVADLARDIRHLAFREGHGGTVELWPLFKGGQKETPPAWSPPLAVEPGDSAINRLSARIAGAIKHWIDTKEVLVSQARPIRAGDVLILVQSRGGLVEHLMRALKESGVPVAGVDRLKLTEDIAVMDLLALAAFALQPRDDLTLATVLKSPLISLSEEELFALCHGRGKETLWASLKKSRADVAGYLVPFLQAAGKATPYEFFAGLLQTPCFADRVSGRRAFYGRLGTGVHDALDEFLNACLHYEQAHTPSLQGFCHWFSRGEAEIKREQEQHRADQVRIMTVHAAKGLQAPIVFLPDAARVGYDHNKARARLLWPLEGGGGPPVPLWSPRKEFDVEGYDVHRAAAEERQDEEYRRLLYVALTRAEDRLYVCGLLPDNRKEAPENSWYSLIERSFSQDAEKVFFGKDADGADQFLRRLACLQTVPPQKKELKETSRDISRRSLPAWVSQPPAPEAVPPRPLAPSKPGEDEPAAQSPLAGDDGAKFRRGVLVHHVLEILPQLPQEKWEKTLEAYLARPVFSLAAKERAVLIREIFAVLRHPDFAPIFGEGSRAEVPVVGLAADGKKVISGQIDRLLVTEKEVLVVDYKSNRPPPALEKDVAAIYMKQMAAYRAVLRNIYPGKPVKCALLWTDGPGLMPLSDKLLDAHAP